MESIGRLKNQNQGFDSKIECCIISLNLSGRLNYIIKYIIFYIISYIILLHRLIKDSRSQVYGSIVYFDFN